MEKNRIMTKEQNVTGDDFQKIANRVSFITIIGNVALSVVKLLAGIVAHSNAMISDAIHSASDYIMKNEHVMGIDLLQTRIFGNKIYVDVEIQVDASYTLQKAHNIAENVHDDIEQRFPQVKHVMVHVNPKEKDTYIGVNRPY